LTFNSSSGTVVALVQRALNSPPVVQRLHSQGLRGKYVVAPNIATYSGPIVDINATASTPVVAAHDVQLLMQEVSKQLAVQQQQLAVPARELIRTTAVSTPAAGTRVLSSTVRRVIAVAVLEMLLILFVAVIAEAFARRKARRRSEEFVDATVDSTRVDDKPAIEDDRRAVATSRVLSPDGEPVATHSARVARHVGSIEESTHRDKVPAAASASRQQNSPVIRMTRRRID
jgi:hypothetical protein